MDSMNLNIFAIFILQPPKYGIILKALANCLPNLHFFLGSIITIEL